MLGVLSVPDPRQVRQQARRGHRRVGPGPGVVARVVACPPARRLTANQLTTAIGEAEQRQTREWAAAEQARREVAERDRAGPGEAMELARQAPDLRRELGGSRVWRVVREQAEQAEARYPEDLREARKADEAELTRMHERGTRHDIAAAQAGTRRDEFIAEQQLREAMPQDQRMLVETTWRVQASPHDLTRALEQLTADRHLESDLAPPGVDLELDYHERTLDRGIDLDRGGPSLGL